MTGATIDLATLDAFEGLDGQTSAGKPVLIDVELVHEDPNQPRKTFDDVKQRELNASVSESGMRVPVSVRPHPSLPGEYMLNFGARRRRAALSAGLMKIPALIEDVMTDFDQVIENLQRADLSPMEMALFISSKQRGGMKPADIASRLGLSRSAISKFFALIDPPPEIQEVYASGRTTSPDTIYDLRRVFDRWPDQTRAWLAGDVDVTRRAVDDLKRKLDTNSDDELERPKARMNSVKASASIRRPTVRVRAGERTGTLVLSRHANVENSLLVRWADTGRTEAVDVSELRLVRLEEGSGFKDGRRGGEKEPRR